MKLINRSNSKQIIKLCIITIIIAITSIISISIFYSYKNNVELDNSFSIQNVLNGTGFDTLWKHGFKGQNVTIAVIDTGVFLHKDIESSVICFKDLVNNKIQPYDDNGHGTEICGIIAGSGCKSRGKYCGVASKAQLVVIKALDKDGICNMFMLQDALNWIIENRHKYKIKLICMSLGYKCTGDYRNDPLYGLINKVKENGILVVSSCGNNGNEKFITLPGDLPNVISVGSVDYIPNKASIQDRYKISNYTNLNSNTKYSKKPDLLAPGTNLITICPDIKKDNILKNYISVSGTSYSAAIIIGEIAVFWSKYYYLNSSQIKQGIFSLETTPLLLYKN